MAGLAKPKACEKCGVEVFVLENELGQWTPYDRAVHDDGTFFLDLSNRTAVGLFGEQLEEFAGCLHREHFRTCQGVAERRQEIQGQT